MTGDLASTVGVKNPYRYRSYRYDTELGFYYLNSRYYDPEVKRFLNADTIDLITATPGALSDKNLFNYCDNNPVMRKDTEGNVWETALDFISLGMSIADVALNPVDPWAWAGLVGDVVDVAIPFVGGVGEVVKCLGTIDDTRDVITAAKRARSIVSDSVGTYEIVYKSGRNYVGKGPFSRAITSAIEHTKRIDLNDYVGDDVLSITWKRAENSRSAFVTEYLWQHKGAGVLSANNSANTYNRIWSPGRRYSEWH